jgi:hypothetical protein
MAGKVCNPEQGSRGKMGERVLRPSIGYKLEKNGLVTIAIVVQRMYLYVSTG